MKRFLGLCLLVFVGVAGWRVGDLLSPDALGVVVGIVFGVLASVPVAILVLAAGRRQERYDAPARRQEVANPYGQVGAAQPPVIVVPAANMALPGQMSGGYGVPPALVDSRSSVIDMPVERRFRVVGEEDGWVDEW